MMLMSIKKWGNSQGLRFSKEILEQLKIRVNDEVNVEVLENKIVITKAHPDTIDIAKLFSEYNGDYRSKEYNWGPAKGDEIW